MPIGKITFKQAIRNRIENISIQKYGAGTFVVISDNMANSFKKNIQELDDLSIFLTIHYMLECSGEMIDYDIDKKFSEWENWKNLLEFLNSLAKRIEDSYKKEIIIEQLRILGE